ncbi:MAG: histidine--tRNA ligase [Candidatus Marinimicrobia bacterium]|nr:histidine--tRNA ligase [Candidatus Neomarinimicrobiota bacterium]
MYRRIKGTKDILPTESYQWQYLEKFISESLERNNYQEIRTPVFEVTELFARGIGTDTDVVKKEMYTFLDKSKTSLTLKPELTAPVVRAYIQNHLEQISPVTKLYYIDSSFRQERPQKGRLRQFHQFGFEIIGTEYPEADAEIIQTVYEIYLQLGIKELNVRLNSIGSRDSRKDYLDILKSSLKPYYNDFCLTCQQRFHKNVLRLFDCKAESCQNILDEFAPSILEYLSKEDHNHFEEVKNLLDLTEVPYSVDKKLVRGLDYYTRTTFEITNPLLGSQDAICGGGRYDYLIEDLGGKHTPAVGVASGMERLLMILRETDAIPEKKTNLLYFAALGDEARKAGFKVIAKLRRLGITTEMDFLRRSLKAQMREAGKKAANWVLILGENEIRLSVVTLKDMSDGSQRQISLENAAEEVANYIEQ